MADPKNPLDMLRGGAAPGMIAEFPDKVGAIEYATPGPLKPGYQGGLFKDREPEPSPDQGLAKAGKYTSRKRVGGKWVYEYAKPSAAKTKTAQPERSPTHLTSAMFDALDDDENPKLDAAGPMLEPMMDEVSARMSQRRGNVSQSEFAQMLSHAVDRLGSQGDTASAAEFIENLNLFGSGPRSHGGDAYDDPMGSEGRRGR